MTNDLISREALKEKLNFVYSCAYIESKSKEGIASDIIDVIDNAPTVDRQAINAEWLKAGIEYAETHRPQGEWIPVSERLPDDETEVLIQYGQSMMVGYHIFDHTIYPFGYEDENETGWYNSKDDFICGSDEVIAWQPLPEPYKKGGAE